MCDNCAGYEFLEDKGNNIFLLVKQKFMNATTLSTQQEIFFLKFTMKNISLLFLDQR